MTTQKQLAGQLQIAESTLSAWAKAGAPVNDGAEAVRRWRNRNLRPYIPSAPPGPTREAVDSDALADELEAMMRNTAVMHLADSMTLVTTLATIAATRLQMGHPLGDVEQPLRIALRAVPQGRRAAVGLPEPVFTALCADVLAAVEQAFPTPAARQADRDAFDAGGAAEREAMGRFWYSIAAGELQGVARASSAFTGE